MNKQLNGICKKLGLPYDNIETIVKKYNSIILVNFLIEIRKQRNKKKCDKHSKFIEDKILIPFYKSLEARKKRYASSILKRAINIELKNTSINIVLL